MACNINLIKTDELGIKVPFSWTHMTRNLRKNQNLYHHQGSITLPGLPWDRLGIRGQKILPFLDNITPNRPLWCNARASFSKLSTHALYDWLLWCQFWPPGGASGMHRRGKNHNVQNQPGLQSFITFEHSIYILGQQALSFSYVLFSDTSFHSWLVWGRRPIN